MQNLSVPGAHSTEPCAEAGSGGKSLASDWLGRSYLRSEAMPPVAVHQSHSWCPGFPGRDPPPPPAPPRHMQEILRGTQRDAHLSQTSVTASPSTVPALTPEGSLRQTIPGSPLTGRRPTVKSRLLYPLAPGLFYVVRESGFIPEP